MIVSRSVPFSYRCVPKAWRKVWQEKRCSQPSSFSLAEMMVVMLIAAVVLAASAPIITRRVQHDQWRTDVFQVLNDDARNAVEFVAGDNQRIFMNTDRDEGYIGIVPTNFEISELALLIIVGTGVLDRPFAKFKEINKCI